MTIVTRLSLDPDQLARWCHRHHIRKLSIFGSVPRGTAGDHSDVDVLVEFEPGGVPGLAFIRMQDELSRLLDPLREMVSHLEADG